MSRREAALRALLETPIAHRGLHAGGRPAGPIENSIGAALAAVSHGFGIECDVQLSRDGEAMVFHDARLDRLTSATGRLADYDADDLAILALGDTEDRIPTLTCFIAAIDGRAPLVVEIKSDESRDLALARRTLEVLANYAGPVALESFDPAIVAHCLADPGRVHPVGLVGPPDRTDDVDPILPGRCDFLSWSIDRIEAIAELYPHVPLTTWTVRTSAQLEHARRIGAQIVFEGFLPETRR